MLTWLLSDEVLPWAVLVAFAVVAGLSWRARRARRRHELTHVEDCGMFPLGLIAEDPECDEVDDLPPAPTCGAVDLRLHEFWQLPCVSEPRHWWSHVDEAGRRWFDRLPRELVQERPPMATGGIVPGGGLARLGDGCVIPPLRADSDDDRTTVTVAMPVVEAPAIVATRNGYMDVEGVLLHRSCVRDQAVHRPDRVCSLCYPHLYPRAGQNGGGRG